jgi:transcriptional regulator with XRE-family HTH domain
MVKPTAKATSPCHQIVEIQKILRLTESEMAEVLKVRQKTLARWQDGHVPVRHRAGVQKLYELALVLRHEVLSSRIEKIIRTPAANLGERSILQVIQSEGVGPIYEYLERLFAYGNA